MNGTIIIKHTHSAGRKVTPTEITIGGSSRPIVMEWGIRKVYFEKHCTKILATDILFKQIQDGAPRYVADMESRKLLGRLTGISYKVKKQVRSSKPEKMDAKLQSLIIHKPHGNGRFKAIGIPCEAANR